MAIKMRNNNDSDAVCCECWETQSQVLNMFDVCIGGQIFTICDRCNEQLFNKTLSAECYKNHRVKSQQDMAIIRKRGNRKWQQYNAKVSTSTVCLVSTGTTTLR